MITSYFIFPIRFWKILELSTSWIKSKHTNKTIWAWSSPFRKYFNYWLNHLNSCRTSILSLSLWYVVFFLLGIISIWFLFSNELPKSCFEASSQSSCLCFINRYIPYFILSIILVSYLSEFNVIPWFWIFILYFIHFTQLFTVLSNFLDYLTVLFLIP